MFEAFREIEPQLYMTAVHSRRHSEALDSGAVAEHDISSCYAGYGSS